MPEEPVALPVLRTLLELEALRDAVHFVCTRPITDIDRKLVVNATCLLYMAAGIESPEAANLLYGESSDRQGERLSAAFAEVIA